MIRPGTPVVFGIQSTAADMRGGITFACAAPEGTLMQGFGANMADFTGCRPEAADARPMPLLSTVRPDMNPC